MKYTVGFLMILRSLVYTSEFVLSLGDLGSVHYVYEDMWLSYVDRISISGQHLYRHAYHYGADGALIEETLIGNLGKIAYSESDITSPYHTERWIYDNNRNLTTHVQDGVEKNYLYNDEGELMAIETPDNLCKYDASGNLVYKDGVYFSYDGSNRLTRAASKEYDINYTYDNLNRRTSKTVNGERESYGHFGINEIVVFDKHGQMKELRIPGLSYHKDVLRPIAIETKDAIYAPIHDIQGNIIKLVDIATREVTSLALPDPFGRGLSKESPTSWIFSGKYYDRELDLVYFGRRYYSPQLKKWLSPDPAFQTLDPYQYCLNKPLSYFDPDGQFAIVIPLIWAGGLTLADLLLDGAVIAGVGWATHEAVKKANDWSDKRDRMQRNKRGSVDPTLPKDPFNDPGLEDISHPRARQRGHYQFKDRKTGEILQYDKGRSGAPGHEGHDHYHRPNPNSTGDKDKYLDGQGEPVSKGSDASHLYPAN